MWVLSLVAVAAIAYLLARMASLLIAGYFPEVIISPKAPKAALAEIGERQRKDIDIENIIKRNFFDPQESVFEKAAPSDERIVERQEQPPEEQVPTNQEAVATSLDIKLVSTIAVGDGRDKLSSCVIQSGRANDVYSVGGRSFAPQTTITRIMPKKVEFLNKGVLEYVALEDYAKGMKPNTRPDKGKLVATRRVKTPEPEEEGEPKGEIQREGNNFTIPRAEVDKALANLSKIYTDIRAVPYFKNGKADGFKLINVKGGSLFEKLGLRRGDILRSVNGTTLDIQTGLQTFNTLKNESSFTLDVERRGLEQTFNYTIQ